MIALEPRRRGHGVLCGMFTGRAGLAPRVYAHAILLLLLAIGVYVGL